MPDKRLQLWIILKIQWTLLNNTQDKNEKPPTIKARGFKFTQLLLFWFSSHL